MHGGGPLRASLPRCWGRPPCPDRLLRRIEVASICFSNSLRMSRHPTTIEAAAVGEATVAAARGGKRLTHVREADRTAPGARFQVLARQKRSFLPPSPPGLTRY